MGGGDATIQFSTTNAFSGRSTEHTVDANTTAKITKLAGIVNMSAGDDFTIDVPMKGGGSMKITPDSVAVLESAAKRMPGAVTMGEILYDRPHVEQSFLVMQGGKPIGEITPQDMLAAIAAARRTGQIP